MGFGKGKGFTALVIIKGIYYRVRGGGGKATKTLTDANPTYTATT